MIRATNKHLNAFQRIAAEHAAIGAQLEAERQQLAAQGYPEDGEDGQYHPESY